MFYLRQARKASIFIVLVLFFTLGSAFAETVEEAINSGIAYGAQGNFDAAIAEFNKAIEMNPNIAEAYDNRAYAYCCKGDLDTAISDYNKALGINPNDVNAFYGLGDVYYKKGNPDLAISEFSKAIGIDSSYAKAYYGRCAAYFFKGDYNNAWQDAHKTESLGLQLDPNLLDALKKASGREN